MKKEYIKPTTSVRRLATEAMMLPDSVRGDSANTPSGPSKGNTGKGSIFHNDYDGPAFGDDKIWDN